jgi:hypothetical protein
LIRNSEGIAIISVHSIAVLHVLKESVLDKWNWMAGGKA